VIDIDDSRAISDTETNLMEKAGKAKLTNPIDYIISNFPNRVIFRFRTFLAKKQYGIFGIQTIQSK